MGIHSRGRGERCRRQCRSVPPPSRIGCRLHDARHRRARRGGPVVPRSAPGPRAGGRTAPVLGHDGLVTRAALPDDVRAEARPTLLYLVKQVELAVRARLDEALRPFPVTALQYTALTVLERRSDLSTAQLARNAFVTDQSAADMVRVLEQRGLILRVPDPGDRRRRVLRLTDAGRELLDRVRADVDAIEARMLAPLDRDETEALHRYLASCRAALAGAPPH